MWVVYSGLATDPFVAATEDACQRLVSNDLEAIRGRFRSAGLQCFGPRSDDPLHVVELWSAHRPDSIRHGPYRYG
jgi:hypothetical protein